LFAPFLRLFFAVLRELDSHVLEMRREDDSSSAAFRGRRRPGYAICCSSQAPCANGPASARFVPRQSLEGLPSGQRRVRACALSSQVVPSSGLEGGGTPDSMALLLVSSGRQGARRGRVFISGSFAAGEWEEHPIVRVAGRKCPGGNHSPSTAVARHANLKRHLSGAFS